LFELRCSRGKRDVGGREVQGAWKGSSRICLTQTKLHDDAQARQEMHVAWLGTGALTAQASRSMLRFDIRHSALDCMARRMSSSDEGFMSMADSVAMLSGVYHSCLASGVLARRGEYWGWGCACNCQKRKWVAASAKHNVRCAAEQPSEFRMCSAFTAPSHRALGRIRSNNQDGMTGSQAH
jgi:hypothetical protein